MISSSAYLLLLALSEGPKLSSELYGLGDTKDSSTRYLLTRMQAKDWVEKLEPVKVESGQGRPQNRYRLTETGKQELIIYNEYLLAITTGNS